MNINNNGKTHPTTGNKECILLAVIKETDMMSRTYLFIDKSRKIVSHTVNPIFDGELSEEYQKIMPGDAVKLVWKEDKKLHCDILYTRDELEKEDRLMTDFLFPILGNKPIFINALDNLDKKRNDNNKKED